MDEPPLGFRPRQERGVAARRRVYDAAIRQFAEKGVAATRIEDVVAAAGVAWGTFYRYFPRKEDVLLEAAVRLGDRLGPVLVQLPPTMQADPAALSECLAQFAAQFTALAAPEPRALRVCVEFRHQSWLTPEVREILAHYNAALCWSDRRGRPLGPLWRTASWGYLRMHEGAAQPWPRYGRRALQHWLDRIAECFTPDDDVYAYFNNDQAGAAPADADALTDLAHRSGWPVRVPAPTT